MYAAHHKMCACWNVGRSFFENIELGLIMNFKNIFNILHRNILPIVWKDKISN